MTKAPEFSLEEAKNKLLYDVMPRMADIHDNIKHLSLEEARQLLRDQIGEDWVEKSIAYVGLERLKKIRPSWYQTFVEGPNGDIGRDEMSDLVVKYMPKEQAVMEIAFYLALNESGLYNYYLNIPLDYDAIDFTVTTGEGEDQRMLVVDPSSMPGHDDISTQAMNVTMEDFFKILGHAREKLIRTGEVIREALQNGTLVRE